MKKELELELVRRYPNLFRDYGGDIRQTCMGWGMSCGDGWYDLIDNIGKQLVRMGVEKNVVADQVKEKFGGLRFYYTVYMDGIDENTRNEIDDIVSNAEGESYKVCEKCGTRDAVTVNSVGWIFTLCGSCREKINKGDYIDG